MDTKEFEKKLKVPDDVDTIVKKIVQDIKAENMVANAKDVPIYRYFKDYDIKTMLDIALKVASEIDEEFEIIDEYPPIELEGYINAIAIHGIRSLVMRTIRAEDDSTQ